MTSHDTSYLEEIKGFSAYYLASEAGVSGPTGHDTYGARLLTELRDEVVQAWEGGRFKFDSDRRDSDVCCELAGETVTVESYPVFAAWAELCVWANGWPEGHEPDQPGTYVFTGPLEDMVRSSLDDMLRAYAHTLVGLIREALHDWECPDCGDTGKPRICYPGDCRGSEEEQEAYRASQATLSLPEGATPDLGIHPRTEVTQADKALWEATEADKVAWEGAVSETQRFMARMSAANIAEFAKRARRVKRRKVALSILAILAGLGVIAAALAQVL